MYYLQNRWKLDGKLLRYYGLRNKENMFNNSVKLTKKQLNIIKNLPCNLTDIQLKAVKSLAENQIITEKPATAPNSLDTARFCARCAANDYIIPGLEFDRQGLCPLCQTKAETAKLKSITPIKIRRCIILYGRKRFHILTVLLSKSLQPARAGADLGNPLYVEQCKGKYRKCKNAFADSRICIAEDCG